MRNGVRCSILFVVTIETQKGEGGKVLSFFAIMLTYVLVKYMGCACKLQFETLM